MRASIIIRTLNEARHLEDLLKSVELQQSDNGLEWETVIVDSGSDDATLEIAARYRCRILHITREEFSFGRSLNIGCQAAQGDILVMISGHCVPVSGQWLQTLCQPIADGTALYAYGRQIGGPESHFSESRIFAKYFPARSRIPQEGFYCNNANAALDRRSWEKYRFNEALTGLEDMELAKRVVEDGGKVAYVAESCVYHYHYEGWPAIRRRFEREALALQRIMPQVQIGTSDLIRYVLSSIWLDSKCAWQEGGWVANALDIVRYRLNQYWGSYNGNHDHRRLSQKQKELYFYPSVANIHEIEQTPHRRAAAHEGK